MKTKLFLLFFIGSSILSANEFHFAWSLGTISNGLNITSKNESTVFDISLLNFYMDYNDKLQLEISPFKYWYLDEDNTHKLTFVNLDFAFEFLGPPSIRGIALFVSVNGIEDKIFGGNSIISFGIRIGSYIIQNHYKFGFINIETGYRYINDKHNVYLALNIEPISTLLMAMVLVP
ncbi:hypothetical protein FACS189461_3900 [Spirochaetia bacterium]|nr:hypothetical protein FACS189461_3900 [Spirochaetia bacterium]